MATTSYELFLDAKEHGNIKPFDGDFYKILIEYAERKKEFGIPLSRINAIDYIAGYTFDKTISLIELTKVIDDLVAEGVIHD